MPDRPQHHVVITDFLLSTDALAPERQILAGLADVCALDVYNEEALLGQIEHADAVILYHNLPMLSRRSIERLRHCRLIVRGGVGYDNIDHAFARARGIPVANVPDYGTEEVADSALGLLLSLTRGLNFFNSRLREPLLPGAGAGAGAGASAEQRGPWAYRQAIPLHRLRGRVLAIVGLGRIGTAMALRGKALGMDVAFFDPFKPDGFDKALGIRRVESIDDLLAQAFALSLHCPLTPATRNFIDASAIGRMPRGSFLINTARGAIVDTAALPAALASGHLAGAGIDVLPVEPPPDDDPFIAAWRDPRHAAYHRAIINPHAAFYCEEGLMDIRTKTAEACRRAILGEAVRNVVN